MTELHGTLPTGERIRNMDKVLTEFQRFIKDDPYYEQVDMEDPEFQERPVLWFFGYEDFRGSNHFYFYELDLNLIDERRLRLG